MAETTYTYSIATDTANGKTENSLILNEITANTTITVGALRVDSSGDVLEVVMKDALDAGQKTALDAVIAAHTAEVVRKPIAVRNQAPTNSDLSLLIHGSIFTANLNDSTEFDIVLAEDRELQGADAGVWDGSPGDYIELAIVHPVAGQIGKFAHQAYVMPSGEVRPGLADATSALPAGMIVRLTYHSVATTGPQPTIVINFRWYHVNV